MESEAYVRGVALATSGRHTQAAQLFTEVIRMQPSNINAWLYLEDCLKDPQKKKECLRHILSINSGHIIARIRLAKLSDGSGTASADTGSLANHSAFVEKKQQNNSLIDVQPAKSIENINSRNIQVCKKCGSENPGDFNFCSNCRTALKITQPISLPPEKEKPLPAPPQGENRAVSTTQQTTIQDNVQKKDDQTKEVEVKPTVLETPTSQPIAPPVQSVPAPRVEEALCKPPVQDDLSTLKDDVLFNSNKLKVTTEFIEFSGQKVLFGDISGFDGAAATGGTCVLVPLAIMGFLGLIPMFLTDFAPAGVYLSLGSSSFFLILFFVGMASISKQKREQSGMLTITTVDRQQHQILGVPQVEAAIAAINQGRKMAAKKPLEYTSAVQEKSSPQPSLNSNNEEPAENEKVIYNQNNVWISNLRLVSPTVSLKKSDVSGFEWRKQTGWWVYGIIILLSPIVFYSSMFAIEDAPVLIILGVLVGFNRLRWLFRMGTKYQLILRTTQGVVDFYCAKNFLDYDALNGNLLSNNFLNT